MSYLIQNEIAENRAMSNRVAQAAAQEQISSDPDRWAYENRRTWAAAPGWSDAWESAKVTDPDSDPGLNEAVITDPMILSQVQAMAPVPPGGGAR